MTDTTGRAQNCHAPFHSEHPPCPLCGTTGRRDTEGIDGPDAATVYTCSPALTFRLCDPCGIAYRTIPRHVEDRYDDSYSESITAGFRSEGKDRHALRVLRRIAQHMSRTGSLLDIGCADGAFLEKASDQGMQTTGVEKQERSALLARARGLTVHSPAIDNLPQGARFDVITLLDVIEHIPDPLPFLKRLAGMLNPGGVLYLETPNLGSLYRYACGRKWMGFILHHDILYSERALSSLLCRAGLRTRAVYTEGFAPFSYDGLRRMRRHNVAYSVLAMCHALLLRTGVRKTGQPVPTHPGYLTRLINAPLDAVVNRGLRRGDQLIVMARAATAAEQSHERAQTVSRKRP